MYLLYVQRVLSTQGIPLRLLVEGEGHLFGGRHLGHGVKSQRAGYYGHLRERFPLSLVRISAC